MRENDGWIVIDVVAAYPLGLSVDAILDVMRFPADHPQRMLDIDSISSWIFHCQKNKTCNRRDL